MITLNFQNPELSQKKIELYICLRNVLCEMLFDFNLYEHDNWLLLDSFIRTFSSCLSCNMSGLITNNYFRLIVSFASYFDQISVTIDGDLRKKQDFKQFKK